MSTPRGAAGRAVALVVLVGLGGCGGGGARTTAPTTIAPPPASSTSSSLPTGEGASVIVGTTQPCVAPPALPVEAAAGKLPPGLSLPPNSSLIGVDEANGTTTVTGETSMGVTELQDVFREQLQAAGYVIHREDNEGIEAELFFGLPDGRVGVVQERLPRCPEGVTRFSVTVAG